MGKYAMNEEKTMGDEMKYTDNKQIREMVRMECLRQNVSLAEIARRLGMIPQSLNGVLGKKHISLDDVQRIADALDCDLYIGIVKR
jgi:transcriptional regulator with XRE-family HTH domain